MPAEKIRLTIGRRAALAGGAVGLLPLVSPAKAVMVNLCVVGTDGWLFPVFDEVRRTDLNLVRKTAQTVNDAVAALKAAKIEVVISFTPAKSRVYREYLPSDFKFSPESEKRYAVALEELRRPGTLVPDQASMFMAARAQNPSQPLFFKADTHWTAAGAEKAAILVANSMKEKLHLPPSTKPGTKLGAPVTVTQERNDLAALLPLPDQARYPFQSYVVRKPVDSGASGLLDDDTGDIVVMGNSFMQPAYGFSSVVSEQLNRPVSLLWKVHQFSPYYNMLNFIKSDGFKKSPPKLIIWNFAENDMEAPANNTGAWGQTAMAPAAFMSDLHRTLGV